MENVKLTLLTENVITGKRSSDSTIIHEIGHSWTGNLVTCSNWANFWMNEGFDTYITKI